MYEPAPGYPLNWKNVLFPHEQIGHISIMLSLAFQLGYKYFLWDDRVYIVINGYATINGVGYIPLPHYVDDIE